MEFLFIRHAESEANCGRSDHCDCDLTEAGRLHATAVGVALASQFDLNGFEGLTSPYRRTRETARLLNATLVLRFDVEPRIREWGKDCEIDGQMYREESLSEAAIRLDGFLRTVGPGRKLVIVSHATPIFLMIQLLMAGDVATALGQCQGAFWSAIKNCGVTHVRGQEVLCLSKLLV